jgi:hypothetical protein
MQRPGQGCELRSHRVSGWSGCATGSENGQVSRDLDTGTHMMGCQFIGPVQQTREPAELPFDGRGSMGAGS